MGHIDEATRPHQFALSTRAGAEALAHSLQLETDTDPCCTVLSVDGIVAFDFVSRRAMLSELQHTPEACAMLPFVRLFYGAPSSFVWTDDEGVTHLVSQAEGGEQGDPLMPALFALGLAPALRSFQAELLPESACGLFSTTFMLPHVTTSPARTASVLSRLEHHLFASLHIRLHAGKTRVWNSDNHPLSFEMGRGGGVLKYFSVDFRIDLGRTSCLNNFNVTGQACS